MDNNYLIIVKFGGESEQHKRVCEILDQYIDVDDVECLRYATLDLNNCDEFVESPVDMSCGQGYKGSIKKDKYALRGYIIRSIDVFPTDLFEAIENQFPYVDITFTCCTANGAISYTNNDYALDKICYPKLISRDGTPYRSQRLNASLHHASNMLKINGSTSHCLTLDDVPESNLESTPIWVVETVDYIPDENLVVASDLWNPVTNNYSDPDLQISNQEMRTYFPNYHNVLQETRSRHLYKEHKDPEAHKDESARGHDKPKTRKGMTFGSIVF